jgi:prophage antirepressor-like protein
MEEAAMTDLVTKVFEGAPVRIIAAPESGEPWFVLADVCRVLDVVNAGRKAQLAVILIGQKPAARRFRRWVSCCPGWPARA